MSAKATGYGLAAVLGLAFLLLLVGAPKAGAVLTADPHLAIAPPTPRAPWTTSSGTAQASWADPFCPPAEGTQNTDPGVAPKAWSALLGPVLVGSTEEEEIGEVIETFVEEAWLEYLKHSAGANPPGFGGLADAKAFLKGKAVAAARDQNVWAGIVQRIANVFKPTTAKPAQFLAHLDQYLSGVGSAACDGNDGYRLYQSNGASALWQLSPEGDWAKLTYETDAPRPPENALWTPVPGSKRTYIASTPTGNPRSPFGIPLAQVKGTLTINPDANVHSCLTDESTTQTVANQLNSYIYEAVQSNASWFSLVPQTRVLALLPKISGQCASTPAVYTPWSNGPVVSRGGFAVADRATHIASYTATAQAATITRWERDGTNWLPGVPFGTPTFNNGFDEVLPRLAISGDGQVVAGCWMGALNGSGFESLQESTMAGFPVRRPLVFHFGDGSITYPTTGTPDAQGCSRVSLNGNGSIVWYLQRDLSPNWFSSPTAPANAAPVSISIPGDLLVVARDAQGARVYYSTSGLDRITGRQVKPSCTPLSGSIFGHGKTQVECFAASLSGSSSASFTVEVRDLTAPRISRMPTSRTLLTSDPAGAISTYPSPVAQDNVDGTDPVDCSPASGARFPVRATIVTCSAVDQAGNAAARTFTVTVNRRAP